MKNIIYHISNNKRGLWVWCMLAVSVGVFATPTKGNSAFSAEVNTEKYTLVFEEQYQNFNHPWGIAWYGSAHEILLVSERNGSVWALKGDTIKEITGLPSNVFQSGQGGFFDIAIDDEETIYLSYAKGSAYRNRTALITFTLDVSKMDITGNTIKAQGVSQIFEMNQAGKTSRHFGGVIAIDNTAQDETVIYLALGERGDRYLAQNIRNHHGSIVKLVKKNGVYTTHVVSVGHRNPQGLYFDATRKKLYETEHGPYGGDEFNLIEEGKNYGWPTISWGKEYSSRAQVGEGTTKKGLEQPLYYWVPISPALSGLTGYYGAMFSAWKGDIFASALKYKQVYRIELNSEGTEVQKVEPLLDTKIQRQVGRIRSIRQAPNGSIYLISDEKKGKVYKIKKKN